MFPVAAAAAAGGVFSNHYQMLNQGLHPAPYKRPQGDATAGSTGVAGVADWAALAVDTFAAFIPDLTFGLKIPIAEMSKRHFVEEWVRLNRESKDPIVDAINGELYEYHLTSDDIKAFLKRLEKHALWTPIANPVTPEDFYFNALPDPKQVEEAMEELTIEEFLTQQRREYLKMRYDMDEYVSRAKKKFNKQVDILVTEWTQPIETKAAPSPVRQALIDADQKSLRKELDSMIGKWRQEQKFRKLARKPAWQDPIEFYQGTLTRDDLELFALRQVNQTPKHLRHRHPNPSVYIKFLEEALPEPEETQAAVDQGKFTEFILQQRANYQEMEQEGKEYDRIVAENKRRQNVLNPPAEPSIMTYEQKLVQYKAEQERLNNYIKPPMTWEQRMVEYQAEQKKKAEQQMVIHGQKRPYPPAVGGQFLDLQVDWSKVHNAFANYVVYAVGVDREDPQNVHLDQRFPKDLPALQSSNGDQTVAVNAAHYTNNELVAAQQQYSQNKNAYILLQQQSDGYWRRVFDDEVDPNRPVHAVRVHGGFSTVSLNTLYNWIRGGSQLAMAQSLHAHGPDNVFLPAEERRAIWLNETAKKIEALAMYGMVAGWAASIAVPAALLWVAPGIGDLIPWGAYGLGLVSLSGSVYVTNPFVAQMRNTSLAIYASDYSPDREEVVGQFIVNMAQNNPEVAKNFFQLGSVPMQGHVMGLIEMAADQRSFLLAGAPGTTNALVPASASNNLPSVRRLPDLLNINPEDLTVEMVIQCFDKERVGAMFTAIQALSVSTGFQAADGTNITQSHPMLRATRTHWADATSSMIRKKSPMESLLLQVAGDANTNVNDPAGKMVKETVVDTAILTFAATTESGMLLHQVLTRPIEDYPEILLKFGMSFTDIIWEFLKKHPFAGSVVVTAATALAMSMCCGPLLCCAHLTISGTRHQRQLQKMSSEYRKELGELGFRIERLEKGKQNMAIRLAGKSVGTSAEENRRIVVEAAAAFAEDPLLPQFINEQDAQAIKNNPVAMGIVTDLTKSVLAGVAARERNDTAAMKEHAMEFAQIATQTLPAEAVIPLAAMIAASPANPSTPLWKVPHQESGFLSKVTDAAKAIKRYARTKFKREERVAEKQRQIEASRAPDASVSSSQLVWLTLIAAC